MPRLDFKKIALLIVFALVVIGLAYLIYMVFFRRAPEAPPLQNVNGEFVSGFPGAGPLVNRPTVPTNVNVRLPIPEINPGMFPTLL